MGGLGSRGPLLYFHSLAKLKHLAFYLILTTRATSPKCSFRRFPAEKSDFNFAVTAKTWQVV